MTHHTRISKTRKQRKAFPLSLAQQYIDATRTAAIFRGNQAVVCKPATPPAPNPLQQTMSSSNSAPAATPVPTATPDWAKAVSVKKEDTVPATQTRGPGQKKKTRCYKPRYNRADAAGVATL